jgi:mono/diheme cytochrome c family protein
MKDTSIRYKVRRVKLLALVVAAPLLSTPVAVDAADVFKGKTIYETYCQACHGPRGRGATAGTPNFTRGQQLIRTDLSLFGAISTGKNAMPGFQGVLTENEILDVITYIRTLY